MDRQDSRLDYSHIRQLREELRSICSENKNTSNIDLSENENGPNILDRDWWIEKSEELAFHVGYRNLAKPRCTGRDPELELNRRKCDFVEKEEEEEENKKEEEENVDDDNDNVDADDDDDDNDDIATERETGHSLDVLPTAEQCVNNAEAHTDVSGSLVILGFRQFYDYLSAKVNMKVPVSETALNNHTDKNEEKNKENGCADISTSLPYKNPPSVNDFRNMTHNLSNCEMLSCTVAAGKGNATADTDSTSRAGRGRRITYDNHRPFAKVRRRAAFPSHQINLFATNHQKTSADGCVSGCLPKDGSSLMSSAEEKSHPRVSVEKINSVHSDESLQYMPPILRPDEDDRTDGSITEISSITKNDFIERPERVSKLNPVSAAFYHAVDSIHISAELSTLTVHVFPGLNVTSGMRSEMSRLSTFSKLDSLPVSAVRLAQNGFYYDEERDEIICFSCNLYKRHWDASEKIAVVHLQLSPDCDHANFRDEGNIPVRRNLQNLEPGVPGQNSSHDFPRAHDRLSVLEGESADTGVTQASTAQTTPATESYFPSESEDITQSDSRSDTQSIQTERSGDPSGENLQDDGTAGQGLQLSTEKGSTSVTVIATRNQPSSIRSGQDGKSWALPPPAGRAEAIDRHQRLAAESAGTALPKSSLAPLTSLSDFTSPEGMRSGQVYFSVTTSQVPSVTNTPAAAELCRYPVQAEQAPTATPDRSSLESSSIQTDGSQTAASASDRGTNVLDTKLAVNPANASVRVRLASFANAPTRGLPDSRHLAMAGFHYIGSGDTVRCFYCGVTLRNWKENDDPWQTHVRFRFSCDYVTAIKGEQFVFATLVKIANGRTVSHGTENAAAVPPTSAGITDASNSLPAGDTRVSATSGPPATTAAPVASHTVSDRAGNTSVNSTTTVTAAGRSSCDAEGILPATANQRPSTTRSSNTTFTGSVRNEAAAGVQNAAISTNTSNSAILSSQASSTSSRGSAAVLNETGRERNTVPQRANQGEANIATSGLPRSRGLQTDAEPSGALNTTNRTTSTASQGSDTSQTTVSREHPATSSTTSRNVSSQDQAAYLQQLQETNRRLRQRRTCRLCGTREVNTIFLPCGHLCTCDLCASTVSDCCLCHDRIRGTAHVYLE